MLSYKSKPILSSIVVLLTLVSCQQAQPLIGPAKSGNNAGRSSSDLSECERITELSKMFSVNTNINHKARYSGKITAFGTGYEYVEEATDCNAEECTLTMYTKNSSGVLEKANTPKNPSKEERLNMCESTGMKLLSAIITERSLTVPAGTFKSQCLRYSISSSFNVENSKPYTSASNNELNSVTTTEHCVSLEPDSAGLLIQHAEDISGSYTDKNPKASTTVALTPSIRLLEIIK
jgi:hypothetical protein